MQKWEYLVIVWDQLYSVKHDQVQTYINRLGEDGWELVSVATFHQTSGTIETGLSGGRIRIEETHGETRTNIYCKLFFKRPKP